MSAIINFYNDNDDETFFNYIYDNTSSDVSIIHDLTCSLLKLKGTYHPDYEGCRDNIYKDIFVGEAFDLYVKLKFQT
jgi:hypothetical protein